MLLWTTLQLPNPHMEGRRLCSKSFTPKEFQTSADHSTRRLSTSHTSWILLQSRQDTVNKHKKKGQRREECEVETPFWQQSTKTKVSRQPGDCVAASGQSARLRVCTCVWGVRVWDDDDDETALLLERGACFAKQMLSKCGCLLLPSACATNT